MNESQQTRYQEQEIRELQHENARLRKKLKETNRHARRVQQAYQDAVLLATWRTVHITPSRSYAAYQGISQRRWQNAVALLRLARVVDGQRWKTTELAIIEQRAEIAKQRALEAPDAFRARLPRHGTR